MQDILLRVEDKVKELLAGEATGHDWYHIKQVRDMSLRIAKVEGGDTELIELAALAHDVGDRKFFGSEAEGEAVTRKVLSECGVDSEMLEKVYEKLLLLKDRMHTATGKKIAQERHAFMEEFLKRFMTEWDAKD